MSPDKKICFDVVSFNIRYDSAIGMVGNAVSPHSWANRRSHVVGLLKSLDGDLIGMQECLRNQYTDLQNALTTYATYGEQSVKHPTKANPRSEFCPIWWKKDRFECRNQGTLWLNKKSIRGVPIRWPLDPRLCTWVNLVDNHTEKTIWIYCTHLDNVLCRLIQPLANHWHIDSLDWIWQHFQQMQSRNDEPQSMVLLGDFNFTPDKPAYSHLSHRLNDTYVKMATPCSKRPRTFHNFKDKGGSHIDYIWTNSNLTTCKYTINVSQINSKQNGPKYYSDHYPVIARVKC